MLKNPEKLHRLVFDNTEKPHFMPILTCKVQNKAFPPKKNI